MSVVKKLLAGGKSWAAEPPSPEKMKVHYIFILIAFISALFCVVGLLMAARCFCLRYFYGHGGGNTAASSSTAQSSPNEGPKKDMILSSVPRVSYTGDGQVGECAICLTEFMKGDEMSVLLQCGHGFHVKCIERWMRRSSSCPSCRQILVEPSRRKGGGAQVDAHSQYTVHAFLPISLSFILPSLCGVVIN